MMLKSTEYMLCFALLRLVPSSTTGKHLNSNSKSPVQTVRTEYKVPCQLRWASVFLSGTSPGKFVLQGGANVSLQCYTEYWLAETALLLLPTYYLV